MTGEQKLRRTMGNSRMDEYFWQTMKEKENGTESTTDD